MGLTLLELVCALTTVIGFPDGHRAILSLSEPPQNQIPSIWPLESKAIQVLSFHYVRKGGREAQPNRKVREPGHEYPVGTRVLTEWLSTWPCAELGGQSSKRARVIMTLQELDEQATDMENLGRFP